MSFIRSRTLVSTRVNTWVPPAVVNFAAYDAEVTADSPLAYWKLAETTGTTVADSSGNSRTLTYLNTPSLNQTGVNTTITKAVSFNGTDEYVYASPVTGLNIAASANWTIELWMKTTSSVTGFSVRWSDGSGLSGPMTGQIDNNGSLARLRALNSGNTAQISVQSAGSVCDGQWHHIVGTAASGGAMSLYVDGILESSSTTARFTGTDARGFMMAGWVGQGGSGVPGDYRACTLAAVAVYSTALSAARINVHYLAGKS